MGASNAPHGSSQVAACFSITGECAVSYPSFDGGFTARGSFQFPSLGKKNSGSLPVSRMALKLGFFMRRKPI